MQLSLQRCKCEVDSVCLKLFRALKISRDMAVLKLHVAISIVPYSNSYSLPKPQRYVPVVICNVCYPRQEEVGCKRWDDHQDSHVVSMQVTAL